MTVRKIAGTALFLSIALAGLSPAGRSLASAQATLPQGPALSAPLTQAVPVDARITIGYLPNGLRYYIRANERPSQRAELRLVVNVGSVVEDSDQLGLAHFVEHMAFNGSEHFPKQDLIKFMESIGMRLGPGVNADTGFDETVYMLHVPTDNPEAMRKAFLFLADVAHSLSFDQTAIDKERGVIVEEWRQGRGADARMRDQQLPMLLRGSRYSERVPIGTRESIEGFKPEALKRFYADWYRPDLMAVIAVGDFNKSAVEALIKAQFKAIPAPARPRPRASFEVPDHPDTLYAVATDKEATMTTVGVYNMLPLRDQTSIGAYRQQQVERLYTNMLNERLGELTVKADPPFIRAAVGRGLFVRSKEAATLMALVKEDGIESGVRALVTESARAARFGFTPAELEREKRDLMRLYEGAFAERDKEESADLAAEYIRNYTQQEPLPGITYEYGLVQRFVPDITLEEVNKVAKEWTGGSRVVLVNAPQKAGLTVPDAARLAAAIKSAAEKDVKPYVEVAANQSLLDELPKPGAVVTTKTRDAFGVTEWELSNGVKVVLKPTEFKQDEVVFRATSPGGTSLASDKDYVAAMTATQVIGAGGVGKFDVIQLRNVLSGKAAAVRAFIDDTEEGMVGGGSPKDLETMFQLIYLTFTQPRADATVFGVITSQAKVMLASQQASPEWAFGEALRSAMTQNHFRARPLTPESVADMDLQKSLAFYKDRFADASDFTFVFAGSYDLAAIKPLVERYLGSLPSLHRKETWKNVGITPPKGVVEKTVRKGIEPKSQAAIVFTGSFPFDSPHQVVLDALAVVLETRLRESLREALSGTYGVQVEASASKIPDARYSINIDFGCDPERTEELVKTLFREIETLKTGGPTDKEVRDAREALRRKHDSDLAVNNRLVGELSARYENSADIAEFFELPMEFDKLTVTAIRDAARSYLDTNNYVRVTLYPEKPPKVTVPQESLIETLVAAFWQATPAWQTVR
ncbi:MAG: insulinase family protein [Acidobacteria bacterium]|nr:insulinase family protein [Acidobacteriota bacterium]